jgi:hypothetical protein
MVCPLTKRIGIFYVPYVPYASYVLKISLCGENMPMCTYVPYALYMVKISLCILCTLCFLFSEIISMCPYVPYAPMW